MNAPIFPFIHQQRETESNLNRCIIFPICFFFTADVALMDGYLSRSRRNAMVIKMFVETKHGNNSELCL